MGQRVDNGQWTVDLFSTFFYEKRDGSVIFYIAKTILNILLIRI